MRIILLLLAYLIQFQLYSQRTLSNSDYNRSVTLYNEGLELVLNRVDLPTAIFLFNEAIILNAGNSDIFYAKALAFNILGKYDSAIYAIDQAISLTDCEPDYNLFAANVYFKQEKFRFAIDFYSRAILCNDSSEVKIDLAVCYFNRANSNLQLSKYQNAIEDYTSSISYNNSLASAYHNRAIAKRNLSGKYLKNDFCKDFEQAVILGSSKSEKFLKRYCH